MSVWWKILMWCKYFFILLRNIKHAHMITVCNSVCVGVIVGCSVCVCVWWPWWTTKTNKKDWPGYITYFTSSFENQTCFKELAVLDSNQILLLLWWKEHMRVCDWKYCWFRTHCGHDQCLFSVPSWPPFSLMLPVSLMPWIKHQKLLVACRSENFVFYSVQSLWGQPLMMNCSVLEIWWSVWVDPSHFLAHFKWSFWGGGGG